MTLSVIMITKNEAQRLDASLAAVSFADEIIVVDSGSTDSTVSIAKRHRARVLETEWKGFGAAKQTALDAAVGDWVLSIDADETVTAALAAEIAAAMKSDSVVGYEIPRLTTFMNRPIRHAGWYPDYVLRLFRRTAGRFTDLQVHERVLVDGAVGRLRNDLLHDSYPSLEIYFDKFNRYTTLGAHEALAAGATGSWYDLTVRPVASLVKHYVLLQGFRDGIEGLVLSCVSACYVLVKYAKVRQLRANISGSGALRT